jgi:methylase of polypeptide subunit release factors
MRRAAWPSTWERGRAPSRSRWPARENSPVSTPPTSRSAPWRLRAVTRSGALGPVADMRARVVVSNPPYIAHGEAQSLPASVRDWEPAVALYSGSDGMAVTARLIGQAAEVLLPGGLLAIEVDVRRASLAAEMVSAEQRFHAIRVELDLTGRERFVLARRRDT